MSKKMTLTWIKPRYVCRLMNVVLATVLIVSSWNLSADETRYRTDSGKHDSMEGHRHDDHGRDRRDTFERKERDRHDDKHRYSPERERRYGEYPSPRVEVHVDGLSTSSGTQRAPERSENSKPSICRQAHSAAWSTQQLDCPNPRPAQRSNVWSTGN